MARWQLMNPHYLKVPGTEWEYKETDMGSGRQGRKIFEVPLYVDPASDVNRDGDCIVCWPGKGERGDIEFVGPPTPDMKPLDKEAEAETEKWREKWEHPIDSLPITTDNASPIRRF